MATNIGKISKRDEREQFVIEWEMENFCGLSVKTNKVYRSPSFSFVNVYWHLGVYFRGTAANESEGFIDLHVYRESPGPPLNVEYSLGLKTMDGNIDPVVKYSYNFEEPGGYGKAFFLKRSKLLERKCELAPGNAVTVVCTLKYPAHFKASGLGKQAETKCSYCKTILNAVEDISSHYQECIEFPIKCPKCSEVVALKNWCDHECQTMGVKGFDKAVTKECSYCTTTVNAQEDISSHLQKCTEFPIKCLKCGDDVVLKNCFDHKCQTTGAEATEEQLRDFKSMMLNADHTDAIIGMKGEEFRLHRRVLASRSPYFHSMFNCSMKEKNTGNVTIDDCEPNVFRSFIHFVYTGKVDKLTVENVCDLYEMAYKYQEDQLKSECLHFMMSTFSIDSFCGFTNLALKHDEKELLENAIKFFARNMIEIIQSIKWQTLLTEYPIQENELLIKAVSTQSCRVHSMDKNPSHASKSKENHQ